MHEDMTLGTAPQASEDHECRFSQHNTLSAGSTRSYFHRQDVSAFLHQENNKLLLSVHELIILFEQVSSHTS